MAITSVYHEQRPSSVKRDSQSQKSTQNEQRNRSQSTISIMSQPQQELETPQTPLSDKKLSFFQEPTTQEDIAVELQTQTSAKNNEKLKLHFEPQMETAIKKTFVKPQLKFATMATHITEVKTELITQTVNKPVVQKVNNEQTLDKNNIKFDKALVRSARILGATSGIALIALGSLNFIPGAQIIALVLGIALFIYCVWPKEDKKVEFISNPEKTLSARTGLVDEQKLEQRKKFHNAVHTSPSLKTSIEKDGYYKAIYKLYVIGKDPRTFSTSGKPATLEIVKATLIYAPIHAWQLLTAKSKKS